MADLCRPIHEQLEERELLGNDLQITALTALVQPGQPQMVRISGTINVVNLPGAIIQFSGAATGSTTLDSNGHFDWQATVDNLGDLFAQAIADESASAPVQANLSAVSLTKPPDQSNLAGDSVSLVLSASTVNNAVLLIGADGLPPGVTFHSDGLAISGRIASDAALGGPYVVSITAIDAAANVGIVQTFTWTVNPPIVSLADPGAQVSEAGDFVSLIISASSTDGYPLNFSAEWLPAGLAINSSTGIVSGMIAADAARAEPYFITITATDASAAVSRSQTFTWSITSSDDSSYEAYQTAVAQADQAYAAAVQAAEAVEEFAEDAEQADGLAFDQLAQAYQDAIDTAQLLRPSSGCVDFYWARRGS